MTRDDVQDGDHTLYDTDFFAWSRIQAAALRAMPRTFAVDVVRVAGEIEDLGRNDLRAVGSLLGRLVEHLVKIDADPDSRNVPHWRDAARLFARDAGARFAPSMRQMLDVAAVWSDGSGLARASLADRGIACAVPAACPFELDDLLARFDLDHALATLPAARAATLDGR